MRVNFRVLLGLLSSLLAVPAFANHFQSDCPLTLVGQTAPTSDFQSSPHGAFRSASNVYLLRGQTLTTLTTTDLGDVQIARQDRVDSLRATEEQSAVAYENGFMYVASGDAGLEIFNLSNTTGGSAGIPPVLVSRTMVPHYKRIAVSGNVLAGVFPADDLPCVAGENRGCDNSVDIYDITDRTAPVLASRISTRTSRFYVGFNDVTFANGFLWTVGLGGTHAFNVSNPSIPTIVAAYEMKGNYFVSNHTTLLGIGQKTQIGVFFVGPGATLGYFAVYTLPAIADLENEIMFHPQAFFDDTSHLITMIDEVNPMTGGSARTVAFDVFDMSVAKWEGSSDRIYEDLTMVSPDEVKFDPLAVGPFVYVNGDVSGAQKYGSCGQIAGKLEFDTMQSLPCGGSELHGYVSAVNRIRTVEVFLDNGSLGLARLGNLRHDIVSPNPVTGWALNVNLDQVAKGEHLFRVVVTDVTGNSRQVFSRSIYFGGPGSNCSTRRRLAH